MISLRQKYGYVIVIAGFLIFGGLLSPISSYGRLFTGIQNDFNTTALQAGWIGSIAWATSFLSSPLAVFIESRIGYCATTVLGSVMTSAAYLISSFIGSYGWLLLVLGFVCGSSAGLCIHATLCVLFKYFSSANHSRASGLVTAGSSVATIFVSISYERLVPVYGWRTTLQVTSIFAAVLAIPASFAIILDRHISPDRHISGENMETRVDVNKQKEPASSKCSKTDDIKTDSSCDVEINVYNNSWLQVFRSWRAWLILFALLFPAMCWSVYWVNTISYFESIAVPENDILLFVTVMAVTDVLGKIFIAVFMNKLPFGETSLLCLCNFFFFALTILFVILPATPVLLICSAYYFPIERGCRQGDPFSLFNLGVHVLNTLAYKNLLIRGIGIEVIGVGRGWYNVLTFRVSVDLLEADNSDQGITLTMIALGAGFTVGTLSAGATYDAIGSYTYAFLLNAILYLLGAFILLFLQMERRMRRSKWKQNQRGPTVVCTIENDKADVNILTRQ